MRKGGDSGGWVQMGGGGTQWHTHTHRFQQNDNPNATTPLFSLSFFFFFLSRLLFSILPLVQMAANHRWPLLSHRLTPAPPLDPEGISCLTVTHTHTCIQLRNYLAYRGKSLCTSSSARSLLQQCITTMYSRKTKENNSRIWIFHNS